MESELCRWTYTRHAYCIIYHGIDEEVHYYSPASGITETAFDEAYPGITPIEVFPIQDDDTVLMLLYRIQSEIKIQSQYLYLYTGSDSDSEPVNMGFDLTYKINKKQVRRLDYDAVPDPKQGFRDQIKDDIEWTSKVTKHDFTSNMLSSFEYPDDTLREIHCYPAGTFINLLPVPDGKTLGQETILANWSHIRTYYPEVTTDQLALALRKPQSVEIPEEEILELQNLVGLTHRSLDIINNPQRNDEITRAGAVRFGDEDGNGLCNILEAVIHVNYAETNEEFVNLKKIFYMINTNEDMPFSRYFMDGEKAPRYKVYHGVTDPKSPLFMNKKLIQDWINPKLNKMVDKTDVYAVQQQQMKTNNRGLSFRFLRPTRSEGEERKYFTLNIYRNGRMDIKCHWDEAYGTEDSPGGTPDLVKEAVKVIIDFMVHLNKLQYHIPAMGRKKITLPKHLNDPRNTNTKVAFFNTISTFDFGEIIDREHFMKFLEQFTGSHIVLVERETTSGFDTRSFEFRYKRVNNYIHIKSIHRMIKQYIEKNPYGKDYKKELIKYVSRVITRTDAESRDIVDHYESIYGIERANARGRGHKSTISGKQIREVLGRSTDRKTGIDIKILKRRPKEHDSAYKCLILGIDQEMVGPVIHFLRYMITYYKNHEALAALNSVYDYSDIEIQAEVDKEGITADSIQTEKATAKKYKARGHIGDESAEDTDSGDETDSDYDASRYSDEEDSDDDESSQDETKQEKETPKPAPPSVKRHVVHESIIEILKHTLPHIYGSEAGSGKQAYSKKCQKTQARQPLVISLETKENLKQFVQSKKVEIQKKLKKATGKDAKDLSLHLRELDIHTQTLEAGANYNDKFFFCPLTWDFMSDSPGWDASFPRLKDAMNPGESSYHYPKFGQWAGKGNSWKLYGTDNHQQALGAMGSKPSHSWYLGFIKDLGDPAKQTCAACCFKQLQQGTVKRRNDCLSNGTSKKVGSSTSTQSYVLTGNRLMLEKDRLARIPDKLDLIFNRDDPKEDGFKLNAGSISPGFNFYLRKGVATGNKFLNAIGELVPRTPDIIEHITEILQDESMNPLEIFKSLKRGSLYQLFMPSLSNPIDKSEIEDLDLPLQRFLKYINDQRDEVDEDFLWDLVSRPGIILPDGFNLIICDVRATGKRRSKQVDTGTIKCPVGFEVSSLFDNNRKTLVLYKYGSTYEIICKVEADDRRLKSINPLFDPGHSLIEEIISYIKTQCHPVSNIPAKQELQKHRDNVSEDLLDSILLTDAEHIDLDRAIEMLNEATKSGVPEHYFHTQVIDSYKKVTHLLFDVDGVVQWLPVYPSGISLDHDLSIMTRSESEKQLPDLYTLIEDCVFWSNFVNFVGYTPYAFLLDPGEDLDDPDDDIIIGIILQNGLITYVQPLPVSDMKKESLKISHPNKKLRLKPVEFDLRSLFFNNREEQWFSDYKEADQALEQLNNQEADWRRVYSVRLAFEQEVFQRMRYELTKLLQVLMGGEPVQIPGEGPVDVRVIDYLTRIIMDVEAGNADMAKSRDLLKQILKEILKGHVTDQEPEGLLDLVGPTHVGFEDMTEDDLDHAYTYNRPFARYECFNDTVAEYREGDPHCTPTSEPGSDLVFVPSVNLVTGLDNNYDNYMERIVEELLRIPLKRFEILNDEMDNFVADHYVQNDQEYYLDTGDKAELFDNIKKMYQEGVDYRDLMKTHYDVANPAAYYAHDFEAERLDELNVCHGTYRNLPPYWVANLQTQNWKIYQIEGPYDCFYKELDNIIAKRNHDSGIISEGIINTRNDIAKMVGNDELFGVQEKRQGWEIVRDVYAARYGKTYNSIQTKGKLLEVIRDSERHRVTELDLSLISRRHNIRFIILTKPIVGTQHVIAGDGFSCLGTTQTTGVHKDGLPLTYVLLYNHNLDDFYIVKDTSQPVAKGYFKDTELPDEILKRWLDVCVNDVAAKQDVANHLFYRNAPRGKRSKTTGRMKYYVKGVRVGKTGGLTKTKFKKAKAKPKAKKPKARADDPPSLSDLITDASVEAGKKADEKAKTTPKRITMKKPKHVKAVEKPMPEVSAQKKESIGKILRKFKLKKSALIKVKGADPKTPAPAPAPIPKFTIKEPGTEDPKPAKPKPKPRKLKINLKAPKPAPRPTTTTTPKPTTTTTPKPKPRPTTTPKPKPKATARE